MPIFDASANIWKNKSKCPYCYVTEKQLGLGVKGCCLSLPWSRGRQRMTEGEFQFQPRLKPLHARCRWDERSWSLFCLSGKNQALKVLSWAHGRCWCTEEGIHGGLPRDQPSTPFLFSLMRGKTLIWDSLWEHQDGKKKEQSTRGASENQSPTSTSVSLRAGNKLLFRSTWQLWLGESLSALSASSSVQGQEKPRSQLLRDVESKQWGCPLFSARSCCGKRYISC